MDVTLFRLHDRIKNMVYPRLSDFVGHEDLIRLYDGDLWEINGDEIKNVINRL